MSYHNSRSLTSSSYPPTVQTTLARDTFYDLAHSRFSRQSSSPSPGYSSERETFGSRTRVLGKTDGFYKRSSLSLSPPLSCASFSAGRRVIRIRIRVRKSGRNPFNVRKVSARRDDFESFPRAQPANFFSLSLFFLLIVFSTPMRRVVQNVSKCPRQRAVETFAISLGRENSLSLSPFFSSGISSRARDRACRHAKKHDRRISDPIFTAANNSRNQFESNRANHQKNYKNKQRVFSARRRRGYFYIFPTRRETYIARWTLHRFLSVREAR